MTQQNRVAAKSCPPLSCALAHALKTFYCRGALGPNVNPGIIGCVGTDEFDLNTLRVNGEIFESGKKKLRIQKYPDTCGRGLTPQDEQNSLTPKGNGNF